ncbi:deferrochelatase/peroxidase EfeB, partial [Streptomyces sp. SID1328]|nr:deferrochelatase/peroxidase EfeB [Streptomyces sp. SID1328]
MPDPSVPQTRAPEAEQPAPEPGRGVSRRALLGTAGATGLVLGAAGGALG